MTRSNDVAQNGCAGNASGNWWIVLVVYHAFNLVPRVFRLPTRGSGRRVVFLRPLPLVGRRKTLGTRLPRLLIPMFPSSLSTDRTTGLETFWSWVCTGARTRCVSFGISQCESFKGHFVCRVGFLRVLQTSRDSSHLDDNSDKKTTNLPF